MDKQVYSIGKNYAMKSKWLTLSKEGNVSIIKRKVSESVQFLCLPGKFSLKGHVENEIRDILGEGERKRFLQVANVEDKIREQLLAIKNGEVGFRVLLTYMLF